MSSYTYVTFRQSLFEQTNFLNKYGIPVISGTPIGTSIEKIGFGSKCIWFSIYPGNQEEYVVYKFYDGNIEADCTIKDISLVNDDGLYDILSLTPLLKWTEVISLLKAWQMEYKDYFYSNHGRILFNSIPVQRPFFIVYK